jgi:hypothetical protein
MTQTTQPSGTGRIKKIAAGSAKPDKSAPEQTAKSPGSRAEQPK